MPSNSYNTTSSGTNSQGNHYCSRDYGSGASNSNSYSNSNGSYYYSNSDGSKYYNSGDGYASYTKSDGSGWSSGGGKQK
ncbi:hypothetical protein JCM6882_006064 [Rhodosporidiobolus microsporus]